MNHDLIPTKMMKEITIRLMLSLFLVSIFIIRLLYIVLLYCAIIFGPISKWALDVSFWVL